MLCRGHDEVLVGVMLLELEQLDGLGCADVHPPVDVSGWRRASVAGIDEIHVPPGGAGRAIGHERLEAGHRRAHASQHFTARRFPRGLIEGRGVLRSRKSGTLTEYRRKMRESSSPSAFTGSLGAARPEWRMPECPRLDHRNAAAEEAAVRSLGPGDVPDASARAHRHACAQRRMPDGAEFQLILGGGGTAMQADLAVGPFLCADPVEGVLGVGGSAREKAEVTFGPLAAALVLHDEHVVLLELRGVHGLELVGDGVHRIWRADHERGIAACHGGRMRQLPAGYRHASAA